MPSEPHIQKNRRSWDRTSDDYQRRHGRQLAANPTSWGVWGLPEQELSVLGEIAGKDILEFGCGGAQCSTALKQQGAKRVVGMDLSHRQLMHARKAERDASTSIHLVQASGEQTPFADASFDIVFCDHGAMTFANPERTVPEASRLLRPGGRFAFNAASPLLIVCWDEEKDRLRKRLMNNYFKLGMLEDDSNVAFTMPYGDWIRLFRRHGFVVENLIEPRPKPKAKTSYRDYAPRNWARKWPAESIWVLTRMPVA